MAITVRRCGRSDPDAPLLVLFHDDGGDAGDGIRIGRRLWPGAPLASLRGGYASGSTWRHLSESPRSPADLGLEADAVDRMAAAVASARRNEPQLVETIAVGMGGGADAVLALLCRYPALFAGAVLCRPRRHWLQDYAAEIARGRGVEVFIVTDAPNLAAALAARMMLSLSGHSVGIRLATPAEEIELGRAWLCRELRGEAGDEG